MKTLPIILAGFGLSLGAGARDLQTPSNPHDMLAMGENSIGDSYDESYAPSDELVSHPWELGRRDPAFGWGTRSGRAGLLDRGRVLVVSKKGTMQLFVTQRTTFVQNGAPVASDHLQDGDLVQADFDIMGNTLIARQIRILQHEEPLPAAPAVSPDGASADHAAPKP